MLTVKKEIKKNRKKKRKTEERKNWVSDTNGDNVRDNAKGQTASVVWVTDGQKGIWKETFAA